MHPPLAPARQYPRRWPAMILTALAVTIAVLVATAMPASAATTIRGGTLTVTRNTSNGALRLSYNGHNYICYRGDLCLYRGGRYASYYKCRTFSNATTRLGWAVNNQFGSGGKALFYGRHGAANYTMPTFSAAPLRAATFIRWYYVAKVRTCT